MEIGPNPNTFDRKAPRAESEGLIAGYKRLPLFRFKVWQLLGLIVILMAVAFLVFPREKMLVSFYREKGMLDEAHSELEKIITKDPGNVGALTLSAQIQIEMGEIDRAIDSLERIVENGGEDHELLKHLAVFYEWDRRPREALKTWERLSRMHPEDPAALVRLIDYYRYYGLREKEADTVSRLVQLESRLLPTVRFSHIREKSTKEAALADPLVAALTRELENLAAEVEGDDPFIRELLVRLYLLRFDYARAFEMDAGSIPPNRDEEVIRALELFVTTGQTDRGTLFAAGLDGALHQGVQNRLTLASVMRWNGLYEKAFTLLSDLNQERPGEGEILTAMAEVARDTDRPETALAAYEKLIESLPGRNEYQSALADLHIAAGRPEKAYPILRDRAERSGGERQAVDRMIDVAGFTEDRKIMEDALSKSEALSPDDLELMGRVGEMYLWIERPDKAYSVYRRMASLEGGKKDHIYKMLEAAEATGRDDLVLEAVKAAGRLHPRDKRLSLRIAETFLAQGKEKEAIGAYLDYLELNPVDEKAMKQLASLYQWTGQPRKTAELLTAIAAKKPGNRKAQMEAVAAAEEAGLHDWAFLRYEELHGIWPEDPVILEGMIRLASWTNRVDRVASILGEISDRRPGDYKKALDAGNAFLEAGRTTKGLFYLERAAGIRPDEPPLMRTLAGVYAGTAQYGKMVEQLESLDALGLINEEERLLLAQAYLDRGQGHKALKHLEHFLDERILPKTEGMMLARAYELSGNKGAALRVYKRLAKDHAQDARHLATLGDHALWLDRIDAALRFYEMALKKDRRNLAALKGSAQIYAWNNDTERAVRRFEAYNRLQPDDYEVRYQLGDLYFGNRREGEAFREYKRALSLMKTTEAGKGLPSKN